jgi:hypothetical protein
MIKQLTLLIGSVIMAQSAAAQEEPIDSAKWDYIESIVQYDADTRYNILLVSQHTDLFKDISKLQKKTQDKFQGTIKSLERSEQELVYKIITQEGLLADLLALGKEFSGEDVEQVLKKPEYAIDAETGAVYQLLKKRNRSLSSIKSYYDEAVRSFQNIVAPLPEEDRSAFAAIIQEPEVMAVLIAHTAYTQELGDFYAKNPEWVSRKIDSLGIHYQNEHKKEVAEYQQELDRNPELEKETLEAAEEYAREFGYDPDELKEAQEEAQQSASNTQVTVNVTYQAYPYWYGYPYWYATPMWRPYPWYYSCGFRFGYGRGVVVFGMPTYHYSMWFYRGPYYRYPSCTRYHAYHHHRYPYSRNGFNNSYRQNNINIQNNNIYVGGKKTNINTGNRYDYNKRPAQSRPDRPTTMPSKRPNAGGNTTRPGTRPAQRPETKPATKTATKPAKPQQRPATQPNAQPAQQPANRQNRQPSTSGGTNEYRANANHRSNWNRSAGGAGRAGGGGARRR